MAKAKNRRKLLRMQCPDCKEIQDSLQFKCGKCGLVLYAETGEEAIEQTQEQVKEMEELLKFLAEPAKAKGNPYRPVDRAFQLLRALRARKHLPGMAAYVAEARLALLPFKVSLMRNTLKANIIFLVLLFAFPVVPLIMGWPVMVSLLMLLPATVWAVVSIKAWSNLRKAVQELEAVSDG